MTANGLLVTAMAAAAFAAYATYGYPPALAAAAVLVALLIAGLPFRALGRRPLRLTLAPGRPDVVRGDPVTVRVTSTGPGSVRLLIDGSESALVAVTARDQGVWSSPPLARGRHTITVASVVDVGALGLWRWRLPFEAAPVRVRATPRRTALGPPPDLLSDVDDGRPAPIGAGTGVAFAGVREYAVGDDVRHIDWAASARAPDDDVLYVRQFTPSLVDDLVVVLDPYAVDPAAFETAVDLACSLAWAGGRLAILGRAGIAHTPGDAEELLTTLRPAPVPVTAVPGAAVVITAVPARAPRLSTCARLVFAVGATGGPGGPVVPVPDLAAARDAWHRWADR
ncbi:DUF58 domain-containing protein [Catenuloplanes sp. NPDC051500]|uniref:DUF58 domain-containing protein n=1 Tax=Catenuloplanes sp. NPDC051500 TaxID=3363959 RepID=UPI0037B8085D